MAQKIVVAVDCDDVLALLFGDYPWDHEVTAHPNITRVANWKEVEEAINAAR